MFLSCRSVWLLSWTSAQKRIPINASSALRTCAQLSCQLWQQGAKNRSTKKFEDKLLRSSPEEHLLPKGPEISLPFLPKLRMTRIYFMRSACSFHYQHLGFCGM